MTIRCLQLNTNRSIGAQDMLLRIARKQKADVLLISEPNKKSGGDGVAHMDQSRDTAIRILTRHMAVTGKGDGSCFSWSTVNGINLVSVYISPNLTQGHMEARLDDLTDLLRSLTHTKVVLAGDYNAKAMEWGNPHTDTKGAAVQAWAAANNLCCLNTGNSPTFRRATSSSVIDLTFITEDLSGRIENWCVLETETLSDHNCITFTVGGKPRRNDTKPPVSWKFKHESAAYLEESLCERLQDMSTHSATALSRETQYACSESLSTRKTAGRIYLPWWTKDVAEAHSSCSQVRRQGIRGGWVDPDLRIRYNRARGRLRHIVKEAKKDYWSELCRDLNENPWGTAYATVMKKFIPLGGSMNRETTAAVLRHLFPVHRPVAYPQTTASPIIPFTEEEVKRAARCLKSGKSGGPDGIPVEAAKMAVKVGWPTVLRVMNSCLSDGIFPTQWKKGRLVLVYKTGKPPGALNAYRPICLLDSYGKMLEHLIAARLKAELDSRGTISRYQFGFTIGKSTVDACCWFKAKTGNWSRELTLVLLLDVKNAFNSASWQKIVYIISQLRIESGLVRLLHSYLHNRTVTAECTDGSVQVQLSSGVPQGSILGPLLWNILYNGVLEIPLPDGCDRGAYADDFALFITGNDVEELKTKAEAAFSRIASWFKRQGLELAQEKTEALIVCGKRRTGTLELNLGNTTVVPSTQVKYLGVWFNRAGTFSTHASEQAAKAATKVATLSRIMANTEGPLPSKRRVIATAVTSIMLYAAPVWARELKKTHWTPLIRVHRTLALRICSGYRTVSGTAVLIIAGTPPITLQALRATRLAEGMPRAQADRLLRSEWQEEWDTAEDGAWTRALIPDIDPWLDRKHGEVDFFLTQLLTGHGAFREYLHRFKRATSEMCRHCDEVDSAEHCILNCTRWEAERRECFIVTGHLDRRNLIPAMLSGETSWRAVAHLAQSILSQC